LIIEIPVFGVLVKIGYDHWKLAVRITEHADVEKPNPDLQFIGLNTPLVFGRKATRIIGKVVGMSCNSSSPVGLSPA
jgi:hypothetical protein